MRLSGEGVEALSSVGANETPPLGGDAGGEGVYSSAFAWAMLRRTVFRSNRMSAASEGGEGGGVGCSDLLEAARCESSIERRNIDGAGLSVAP